MTFAEAAMIMMSGGSRVIKSLEITKNGVYNAPMGVDGYTPVTVAIPDRYQEGYNQGYSDGEAAVKAKIQSKTITKNGTYYAADDEFDGFDPVIVKVGGTTIDGTIYNPNDPDKNYPIEDPTIINAADINDVIGGTVISPGEVVTVTGIDGNADCALRIYIGSDGYVNRLWAETVNLATGATSKSYSIYSMTSNTDTFMVTGIKFDNPHHVIVSYVLTYASGSQYGGAISQQAGNAHGTSYGTAVAVTSGALP